MTTDELQTIGNDLPPSHGCSGARTCSVCIAYRLLAEVKRLLAEVKRLRAAMDGAAGKLELLNGKVTPSGPIVEVMSDLYRALDAADNGTETS